MVKSLSEIARLAGVSRATVSRVINNKPGASEQTRNAVFSAMESLGMDASRSIKPHSRLVALITPDLINPIFPLFANTLGIKLAQQRLIPLMLTYTSGGAAEETYIEMLLEQDIAGAIFIGGQYSLRGASHEHYQLLDKQHIPAVYLNAAGDDVRGPNIVSDDRAAARLALQHLVDLGHTEIGLILGNRNSYPSVRRFDAARDFFDEIHMEFFETLAVWTDYSIEAGQSAAKDLINQGVTAISCASDMLALGAIRAAQFQNLRIPEDISIVGYDDSRMMAFVDPALTTVRQPVELMSEAAVQNLLRLMHGPGENEFPTLLFEPELVVRRSTARCAQRQ
jgi:DNA-binding LacI/PurR family transcriptional regulator